MPPPSNLKGASTNDAARIKKKARRNSALRAAGERIKPYLKIFSSLQLTLFCLSVWMVLIVLCTLDQAKIGLIQSVDLYFRNFFLYKTVAWTARPIPVFPAGGLVGSLLFVNLLAAAKFRWQLSRQKVGIWLIHTGLALFIFGEFVTARFSVESQMELREGQTLQYSESFRDDELVIINTDANDFDQVYSVGADSLKEGKILRHADWPFSLTVKGVFLNAALGHRPTDGNLPPPLATQGWGPALIVRPLSPVTKFDERNDRAAYVEVHSYGKSLGIWLLSSRLRSVQPLEIDGKKFVMVLRPKRYYLPYSVKLEKFSHDKYPGTEIPKNFSSLVRLQDAGRGVDREVLISMNQPLRYRGKTFFQNSFGKKEVFSVLEVVNNPGWLLPYFSFCLSGIGLLLHFGLRLRGVKPQKNKAADLPSAKKRRRFPTWLGWSTAALAAWCAVSFFRPPTPAAGGIDASGFGELPVLHNGRMKPLDTVARTALLMISAKSTLRTDQRTLSASEWLLETGADPKRADTRKIFVIHDPDVLGLIERTRGREKKFSYEQLLPHFDEIHSQATQVENIEPVRRSRFQSAVYNLNARLALYSRLQNSFLVSKSENFLEEIENYKTAATEGLRASLEQKEAIKSSSNPALDRLRGFFRRYGILRGVAYFRHLPPAPWGGTDDWLNIGEGLTYVMRAGGLLPGISEYAGMLAAYRSGDEQRFSEILSGYKKFLDVRSHAALRTARFESWLSRADPMTWAMGLYVLVLLTSMFSWLTRPTPLRQAAVGLLIAAFALHTFGLLSRMWLQGRPPVTNLYSSAVFVGWAAVLFAMVLERLNPRAIASAVAGAVGFSSLIIAHHLSMSGDTLEMMQAVLDSNFWLGTHVVTITIGYSGMFLAGFLAHVYLLRRAAGALDAASGRSLVSMTYGVVCGALLFSFIGTVLGGIWADQSWGRFWGWDPKENGALLIVVWAALLLHARMAGIVRDKGIMVMAVFGNIVTSLSWFGVNMLGIGLHSYGFMDKAFWWLTGFIALQFAVMMLAALPTRQSYARIADAR